LFVLVETSAQKNGAIVLPREEFTGANVASVASVFNALNKKCGFMRLKKSQHFAQTRHSRGQAKSRERPLASLDRHLAYGTDGSVLGLLQTITASDALFNVP
jgi:hypothetical protein